MYCHYIGWCIGKCPLFRVSFIRGFTVFDTHAHYIPQLQKAAVRRRRGVGSGSGDSERVRQLERQVRGLNDVIKKRYPNSLSALILAATTSQRGDDPTGTRAN